MTTPSQYKVSYTAVSRGQHKLHVQVNDREINGSPFTITVYLDPTQLGRPVRVVTDLTTPYGIAYNSRGEMIEYLSLTTEERRFEHLDHMVTVQIR